mgnify:FL=1
MLRSSCMKEQPVLAPLQAGTLNLAEETRYAPNGIVSRTLLALPQLRVVLFAFDAGQELTEHTTSRHAWVQVLDGSCEFDLAGRTHRLGAGQVVYMPPGVPHAVRAVERFSMLLILTPPTPAQPGSPADGSGSSAPAENRC